MPIRLPAFFRGGYAGGGSSGGDDMLTPQQKAVLDNLIYDSESDRIISLKSFETKPSSFYLGDGLSISNSVRTLASRLPTGEFALAIGNRFNLNEGSISNPIFLAIDAPSENLIETSISNTLADPFQLSFSATGDYLYKGFKCRPATAGTLRVEFWLGSDNTAPKIIDTNRTISQAEVDGAGDVLVEFPNPVVLYSGDPLFLRISGVQLKGGSTLPYYVTQVHPIKEVTINGNVEFINTDTTLLVGGDYMVDCTSNPVSITVPLKFKNAFIVTDSGDTFSSSNPCVVDFSAFSQGTISIPNPGKSYHFYYDGSQWRYFDKFLHEGGVV